MAARIAVSATVRAVKGRKPFPTRAALVLVNSKEIICKIPKTHLIISSTIDIFRLQVQLNVLKNCLKEKMIM